MDSALLEHENGAHDNVVQKGIGYPRITPTPM